MLGSTDWTGVADVIASTGAALAAVIAAVMANRTHTNLKTPNGETRTVGELMTDVSHAVEDTPPAPPKG